MAPKRQQQQQQQHAAPTAPMYVPTQQSHALSTPNAIPWAALPAQTPMLPQWVPPSRRPPNTMDGNQPLSAVQLEELLPGVMCAAQLLGISGAPRERQSSIPPPRVGYDGGQYTSFSPRSPAGDQISASSARQTKKRREFSPGVDEVELAGSQPSRSRGRRSKPKLARRHSTMARSPSPDGHDGSYRSRSRSPQDSARATPAPSDGTPSRRTRASKAQQVEAKQYHKGVDLNSSDCRTPDFQFVHRDFFNTDIHIFKVTQPLMACIKLKECLVEEFAKLQLPGDDYLRLESQDLHLVDASKPAYLVLLMDAVHVDGNPRKGVSVAAIISKDDSQIRWFYTIFSPACLLRKLEENTCLRPVPKILKAHTLEHGKVYTLLREAFLKAVEYPHHPDYVAAQALTDYSPPILDPDTAVARLESHKDLYFSHNGCSETLDLEHDRYLLSIEPAERFVASDLNLHCSAYLLLKRSFFQAFWRDLIACKEKVGDGRRKVRTEHAHEAWLINEGGLKMRVARRLVIAWRVLGLLEEKRFLPWLKAGGMVEEVWKDGDGVF